MIRTKIVATIGPVSANRDSLLALSGAGMNVARLNGSHANLDWHAETIRLIHDVLPDTPILLDIPGRKIRTMMLDTEPTFGAGDTIILTTDKSHDGSVKVPVSYDRFHEYVSAGNTILADDGTLKFTILEVAGIDVICRADVAGILKSRKGINVPHVHLGDVLVTDKDREMIGFAKQHEVDFVGISFVESAEHVEAIRELIDGSSPRVLAKVENQGGLDNLREIVEAADALMVDRGDLSVETTLEDMVLHQKAIIEAARKQGKPVIVATEMLHSMIDQPQPTKAEVSDITNAIFDGCAATMLSGETAIGKFPVEAVSVMRRISDVASDYVQSTLDSDIEHRAPSVPQAVEDAIAMICRSLKITKIVTVTISGYAARMVAARRPRQPIIAVGNDRMAARSFNILPGTEGVFVDVPFSRTSTDHLVQCLKELWIRDKLSSDDLVLLTAVGYPRAGNRMNIIQTHYVRDLKVTLNWTK